MANRMACPRLCRVWLMSLTTQESRLFQALASWFPWPQATVLPDASPGPHLVVQHGVALPGWVPWTWKCAQSCSELAFSYILWPSHLLRAQTQVCVVGRTGKKQSKETTEVRSLTLTHWLRTWLVHLETLLRLWVFFLLPVHDQTHLNFGGNWAQAQNLKYSPLLPILNVFFLIYDDEKGKYVYINAILLGRQYILLQSNIATLTRYAKSRWLRELITTILNNPLFLYIQSKVLLFSR